MVTRILIADDHGVVREGLALLLEAESTVEVMGMVATAEEAVAFAAESPPDLILMDISMPEMGGIEATRRVKARAPGVRVLILTVHEDKVLMSEAVNAGASGYLLKQAIKAELLHALDSVMRDELYVHPVITRILVTEMLDGERAEKKTEETPLSSLTPREVDVLRLLAQGHTNRQAADMLGISVRTVEYHRANLAGKLKAPGRVALVKYAEEHGLL